MKIGIHLMSADRRKIVRWGGGGETELMCEAELYDVIREHNGVQWNETTQMKERYGSHTAKSA